MKLLVLLLAGCAAASGDNSVPNDVSIAYRTYSLMIPRAMRTDGGAVSCEWAFVIRIGGGGGVSCGWEGGCPHGERPQRRPALSPKELNRLTTLADKSGFFALRDFNRNPNIIDGGMQEIEVHLGRRAKKVEMANITAPAFTAVRDALFRTTGCQQSPPPD